MLYLILMIVGWADDWSWECSGVFYRVLGFAKDVSIARIDAAEGFMCVCDYNLVNYSSGNLFDNKRRHADS
jgi:hypothetical protein